MQDAGLRLLGLLSAPAGWESGSRDSRGAPRPQGTEPGVHCKQGIGLQSLTGQQNQLFLVREVNANTILHPHNKHFAGEAAACAVPRRWEYRVVGW